MRQERRKVLAGMGSLFLGALVPGLTWAQPGAMSRAEVEMSIPGVPPEVNMVNSNTGDTIFLRFWRPEGYDPDALALADWFMRDWREDAITNFDPRLLWGLANIRHAFMQDGHDGVIQVHSGFRTPKTNEMLRRKSSGVAGNSFHLKARAVDFRLPNIPIGEVAEKALETGLGGVGQYMKSDFVHLDTGPQRFWHG